MPKIIENLKEDILATTEKLLAEKRFSAFSIRSLSKELSIAPATIYNYYENKEQIIGEVITLRWQSFLTETKKIAAEAPTALEALTDISHAFHRFMAPMTSYWAEDEDSQKKSNKKEHIREKKHYMVETLSNIVSDLLQSHAMDKTKAEEISPMVTKMLVLIAHDSTIDFKDMVHAIQMLH